MTHIDVSALGFRVRLVFGADAPGDFVDRVRDAWQDAAVSGEPPEVPELAEGPDHSIDREPGTSASSATGAPAPHPLTVHVPTPGDEQAILERLSVDVTLAALKRGEGNRLMFHAAGIADAAGNVVAFVGPSGRGKTTASRFLAQHYGYVSDETIAVETDATLHPYRKPLSVIREGQPKAQIAGSTLGLKPLPEAPLRLHALVLLNRVDEACAPTLERVYFAQAVPELIAQMSYFPSLASPFEQLAAVVDGVGGVLRLTYSEADELLPAIEAIFAGRVAPLPDASGERVSRVAAGAADAFDTGDELLVLTGRTVHVLDGIAPEIWRGASASLNEQEITDAVVTRFGTPPVGDPADLVRAAIAELTATGLLAASTP